GFIVTSSRQGMVLMEYSSKEQNRNERSTYAETERSFARCNYLKVKFGIFATCCFILFVAILLKGTIL
uniref:hypothetical protein n=1 Tax=Coprococcus sp. TaxID=2049024 RepID=UPI0040258413